MCTGGESNQGPLGPKSDALSTAPLRPSYDLLNSDNPYFEGMVNQMYPPELQLNKANTSDTEPPPPFFINISLFQTALFPPNFMINVMTLTLV